MSKKDIGIYMIYVVMFLTIAVLLFIVPFTTNKKNIELENYKEDNIALKETIDLLETKVQEQYDIVLEKNAENKELKEDVENLETLIELIASHYDLEGEEFELWLFINHREIYDWLVRR